MDKESTPRLNTNQQRLAIVSKRCEMDFVHPQHRFLSCEDHFFVWRIINLQGELWEVGRVLSPIHPP